jgi:hypothetical protein
MRKVRALNPERVEYIMKGVDANWSSIEEIVSK